MKAIVLNITLTFLIIIVGNFKAVAQGSTSTEDFPKYNIKDLQLKYAVPTSPAFLLIDQSDSEILRPTSLRELTAIVSNVFEEGTLGIPPSLAIEFSPALLLSGNELTLEEYKDKAVLYNTHISIATKQVEELTNTNQISFGIRSVFNDEADIRLRDSQNITSYASEIHQIVNSATTQRPTEEFDPLQEAMNDPKIRSKIKEKIDEYSSNEWNSDVSVAAFALSLTTSDTLANKAILDQFTFWYMHGEGLGKWAQFFFGGNLSYERDPKEIDKFIGKIDIASRLYIGTNEAKFFTQVEGNLQEKEEFYFNYSSGLELNLHTDIWLNFEVGYERDPLINDERILTNMSLRFAL